MSTIQADDYNTPPTCPCAENNLASTDIGQNKNTAWIFATFIGGALVLNSYLWSWLVEGNIPQDQKIISTLCAMLGAAFLSYRLFYRTTKAVLKGRIYIGEMASLAILACFAIGNYQVAGIVAFFLMLAELLETRSAMGARSAVESLIRLTPNSTHIVKGDKEEDIEVKALQLTDIVRVRPGENVPTDGIIKNGETTLNQASITGESLPVDKMPGDQVFAGTVNLTGVIEVEVTRLGEDTTLGKVKDLILQAESTKLPIMRIIDEYIQWYAPAMLMIAAAILYFTGDINKAITALVASCPCALVLATPTAMVAGLSAAARLGILIKNVAHLESAGSINAVMLDKTGTLTTGELNVARLAPAKKVEAGELLKIAASADRHSNHPAARALVKVANEARVEMIEATDMQEFGGKGVQATLDGDKIIVGRKSWLEELGIDTSKLEEPAHNEEEGYSTIYAAKNKVALGWIGLLDKTRPDALHATEHLKEAGVRTITMVTGDRWGAARRVAAELGCTDLLAECLPEKKLEAVEQMKEKGYKVMVVGDGVNDAPALAAGDLGVAMGAAGNDVAIHSASVALLSSELDRLPFLIRLSRNVRGIVVQNLIFSILFVILGLVASGLGWLSPVFAAILNNVGSLIVIFNSAKIVRFGEELHKKSGA